MTTWQWKIITALVRYVMAKESKNHRSVFQDEHFKVLQRAMDRETSNKVLNEEDNHERIN